MQNSSNTCQRYHISMYGVIFSSKKRHTPILSRSIGTCAYDSM